MKTKLMLAVVTALMMAFTIQAEAFPRLYVNNVELNSMRDPDQNIHFSFNKGYQSWSLLAEYSGWHSTNSFGYYTGDGSLTTVFEGEDKPVHTVNTNISTDTQIGLWLWADKNENDIYDLTDPMLSSQRDWRATTGTKYNAYQYFYVYDVRAFKSNNTSYYFDNDHEDFETYGEYDYLIYIDDSGVFTTDKDHNDMIVGVKTSVVPEPSTLLLIGLGLSGAGLLRRRFK